MLEWHSALIFGEIVQTWYILGLIIFQTLQSVTTVSVEYKKSVKSQIISPLVFKKFWEHCGWFYFVSSLPENSQNMNHKAHQVKWHSRRRVAWSSERIRKWPKLRFWDSNLLEIISSAKIPAELPLRWLKRKSKMASMSFQIAKGGESL